MNWTTRFQEVLDYYLKLYINFCKHEEHNYYLNNTLITCLSLPNLLFINMRHHVESYSFHMVNNKSINQSYNWVGKCIKGNLSKARQQSKTLQILGWDVEPVSQKFRFFGCIWGNINLEKENVLSPLTLKLSCFARTWKHSLSWAI